MCVSKLSCKCRKKEEKEETKIRETNKSEKKRKYIIYTLTYLPGNGAKNLTRSKS